MSWYPEKGAEILEASVTHYLIDIISKLDNYDWISINGHIVMAGS